MNIILKMNKDTRGLEILTELQLLLFSILEEHQTAERDIAYSLPEH